ncbi:DUF6298 domain-containing protein [Chitinophaga sp.]|uniref:DUF6298 domain-containing protein n=1 Tax=Chitinophaga sp. TaxID=1869181 RepID=UPI002B61FE2B|nr:DUF6298 domain-containing protein [Chitinophaga sp.]HWV67177.1 DUF6298 domain-containing protein [Chitinophaga sp.]
MKKSLIISFCLIATGAVSHVTAQKKPKPVSPVALNATGKLVYTPDPLGNRIPDFSYSGYMAGGQPVPDVPVRIVVPVIKGDATPAIQEALDYVAALPADQQGIRGAVQLAQGNYHLEGGLLIRSSGVVLRGSGMGTDGTVLTGEGHNRQTLIRIAGQADRTTGPAVKITDAYVPVNARTVHIADTKGFKAGDKVMVQRPSTREWIHEIGMEHQGGGITTLGWKPGERNITWDRTITAVNGTAITLDAPLTTALDTAFGGGTLAGYNWPGRISQTGVEHLRCRSVYDTLNPKDEAHRWMAITLENVCDAWVRQVTFEHFAGSAVAVLETGMRITVEDCKSLAPVSEIGGQRRYTFFTAGQQTLFQRNYAENGYHDFAVGFCAPGPNAFVQCEAHLPLSFSGPIDSWTSGVLFDIVNVDGQAIRFGNLGQDAQGAGWSAANSVLWQCSAARIDCYRPPTANNWAFGSWAQFAGNGYWESSNEHINPRSLYYAQLAARIGDNVLKRAQLLPVESEASSSPAAEQAAALTAGSVQPALTLQEWIDQAAQRNPIPVKTAGVKMFNGAGYTKQVTGAIASPMRVSNGWLLRGNTVLTGRHYEVPWWRGNVRPDGVGEAMPAITRFVPGRIGKGLTDDLEEVASWMTDEHIVSLEHNYGLWYDRRRDDHERIRRMDGEVWPPFYELPFARSGQGTAWDGLSRYDLTSYNDWYWMRLKQFADLADEKGLVLIHQDYFQHNIIEAGAHWADFPWRSANNINHTGFPEPPPYAGDKRIFMAAQFYDITDPVRRKLHTAYIRKCLSNFAGNNGVIQYIGAEFTGPVSFVEFWIDTILEWEKETGKKALIGLSTTRDVQDAILADPVRSGAITVIDIRQWHYQADGSLYAPKGGQSLAPRQHARLLKPKKSSFEQVYRAVREYRRQYPGKAVTYAGNAYDEFSWAAFMAGGSLAGIPTIAADGFLEAAATMQPVELPGIPKGQWILGNGHGYIIYATGAVQFDPGKGTWHIYRINPENGHLLKKEIIKGGKPFSLASPQKGPVVIWVSNK